VGRIEKIPKETPRREKSGEQEEDVVVFVVDEAGLT
jgi:hypothetical protein